MIQHDAGLNTSSSSIEMIYIHIIESTD